MQRQRIPLISTIRLPGPKSKTPQAFWNPFCISYSHLKRAVAALERAVARLQSWR
jgi:hypothetical protein